MKLSEKIVGKKYHGKILVKMHGLVEGYEFEPLFLNLIFVLYLYV